MVAQSIDHATCRFYGTYVSDLPQYSASIPEFPAWFIPFVMQWLNENDELSMDFLRNAYDRWVDAPD